MARSSGSWPRLGLGEIRNSDQREGLFRTFANSRLLSEFPHAESVLDAFAEALATHTHVKFPPVVLVVGSPGSGKTTFAARLLDVLGVPCEMFSCGGVADAALAGTARRWSSGEPALPVALVERHLTASPGIVLDEVEKVGTSRKNGAPSGSSGVPYS
jgi:ATP-dependent Lon protease